MLINRSDCIINAQFEGNVTNSSGTDGTVTGTEQYADGTSGKAFDFDGSTHVAFGNTGLSNSSDLTVFLRMNLDTHTTGDVVFAKKTNGVGNGFMFQMYTSGTDEFRFRVRNAADSAWVEVSLTLPETNLYAIRCEINLSNEITISALTTDGTLTTASATFSDATYTSNTEVIALGNQIGGNAMDGKCDDFTVITSILSDYEFYKYYLGTGISNL